jgi:hypothetical protein
MHGPKILIRVAAKQNGQGKTLADSNFGKMPAVMLRRFRAAIRNTRILDKN